MAEGSKSYTMIADLVTGREVPNVGAEENRQAVERLLVGDKGYLKSDIAVSVPLELDVAGEPYRSRVDLLVSVDGRPYMAVKCAAGSLGSCEREIVAAARLLDKACQIPLAVVSDGRTAIVIDTVSGTRTGEGLDAIPSKVSAISVLKTLDTLPLAENRRMKESLYFAPMTWKPSMSPDDLVCKL